jgi:antitoxin component YwqK of YwqJK toxin-antitoxin module
MWRADGVLERQGAYKDGLCEGEWTFHGPDGQVAERRTYAAGKLVAGK